MSGDEEAERIRSNFKLLDVNGDGTLEKSELKKVLQGCDAEFWTDERIDNCISAADADSDNKIQYEEFLAWIFLENGTQDEMTEAFQKLGLPKHVAELPLDRLKKVRDAVETLLECKISRIRDTKAFYKKVVAKLQPPEAPLEAGDVVTSGNDMPFVRFDSTAVPKEIGAGCEIYVKFLKSGNLLGVGDDDMAVGENADYDPSLVLAIERHDAGDASISSGDAILLRHVGSGKYLQALSDSKAPLTFGDRAEDSQAQTFTIFKERSPKAVKHKDVIFIQSWLSNYVGLMPDLENSTYNVAASRWQRGDPQIIMIFKKAVIEATTTDVARQMQFQAFDLDGNANVSKSELSYMLKKVQGECNDEELESTYAALDPEGKGKITRKSFMAWADAGCLSNDCLHHAEVIGNTAQRCNDCLHVNETLNKVLSTVPSSIVFEVCEAYRTRFGAELIDDIEKKGSEQDGFIFSSHWKLALRALVEPEADLWTRALNDAMRGLGTDEHTLTALVCSIPERLRDEINTKYEEKYRKRLLKHIQTETSFNYKKVLELQAMSPAECNARLLNTAMVGFGTDEEQLVRVISLCDFGERRAIKEVYASKYERDLVIHIESETSGDLKKALVTLLTAEESEFDLEADCAAMKDAMDGWGTDEEALVKLILSKTPRQMEEINKMFEELYDRQLFNRVRDETSGHLKTVLLSAIRPPIDQLAEGVRACIKGWGTDDSGLICMLVHLPEFKKEALKRRYQELFGRDLIEDIEGDTSGNYKKALCALVKPAPTVWAEAITGAMKGLGTSDELLINFIAISKDYMDEVRLAFKAQNGKSLAEWINGDCSGDYKDTLIAVAKRDSQTLADMEPIFWAQRLRDALTHQQTLTDILVALPAVAVVRGTEVFTEVYGKSMADEIKELVEAKKPFFSFSNYWGDTMNCLVELPVVRYVRALNDAMRGIGTDEFTLTGLVCTMPENIYADVHKRYEEMYSRTLVNHIEEETSSSYKKLLVYQALSWPQSRAKALHSAIEGEGALEDQVIRILICSTVRERTRIMEAYEEMYSSSIIADIETKLSGPAVAIFVAILESNFKQPDFDFEDNCHVINDAMEDRMSDVDHIVRIFAGKTPEQLARLEEKFEEVWGGPSLVRRLSDEEKDWGNSIFGIQPFRNAVLGLLRTPQAQLAYSVRDCLAGFADDDTGLITCLVHLPEKRRADLVEAYKQVPGGGDLFDAIKNGTSGDFEQALLALVKPAPTVIAEALIGAMQGVGTSDELLIHWMCIAKDRMDQVRTAFEEQQGKPLHEWIESDCSGDYKDILVSLSKRECMWFSGVETALTIPAPPSKKKVVQMFRKTFNALCRKKKTDPDSQLVPPEEAQQEMGCVFQYYASVASTAPNLDKGGLWDLTNAVGFPPADDGPDLDATFDEWNYSGSGEITWNDFVREMTTRVNDPNHYEAPELEEVAEDVEDDEA